MGNRVAECTGIIGMNGTGKTTFTIKIAEALSASQPVFIVHVGKEKKYDKYKEADISTRAKAKRYKTGIYSINPLKIKALYEVRTPIVNAQNGSKKERITYEPIDIATYIYDNLHNAVIFFDDFRDYYPETTLRTSFEKMFIGRRQRMLDLYFVAHGFSLLPPRFYAFITKYILFATAEKLEVGEYKMPAFDSIKKYYDKVQEMAAQDPYAKVIFKTTP